MMASQALLTVLNLARDSTGSRIMISQTISSGSSKVCCCGSTLFFFFPFLLYTFKSMAPRTCNNCICNEQRLAMLIYIYACSMDVMYGTEMN